ncbi:MAG: FAD-dependent 5-carboxymethylaminomethyl-2-thiouridine(34) oxidoreductase MnmC [Alphaproteobacteria bacterium]|nr:FAD-dependent 5-carboxymethylaminomethyl-2-thiouridine(34) oxidoreductase MnmC [Alphaproteobacteria bacterium]MBP7759625.1 FAD-dependent 5-carboxymethylaminomethyl-2-thiouridine(34) oxidoreductase MnmC [Alphaproteobacteria bacterium]MBP7763535.1 FAD-dependent 5-carboxymethylaminomethyl-2-thiouridine(34) oxidoreductase MnmC [Alphaproteobacteria bacterium]MBP7906212.1 FAD-dependent 5-carboxymethylaminomethyl-2-thiouridine(34) oxidoreductase MnmC [Alphaproteobacteria bacterium]
MKIAIIGGGLAGTACAYVFRRTGLEPVLYEEAATLAPAASGNAVGLYNPRFTAEKGPEQEFYSGAFFAALKVFETLEGIDWNPCGALHLVNDEKKAKRFPQTAQNWGWGADEMRMVHAKEASEIAGVKIEHDALYLARPGTVSPRKLCAAYAEGVEVHLDHPVSDLSEIQADAIVLAGGMGLLKFPAAAGLPLRAVRGQVTYIDPVEETRRLRCTLGYGGYVAPVVEGVHCVGSTFQRWLDHSEILGQDDLDNLLRLHEHVPAFRGLHTIAGQRAAVRTTAPDHFPIVGTLDEGRRIYVSTAHGSHGILSSLRAAEFLAEEFTGVAEPTFSEGLIAALSPQRFRA